MMEKQAMQADGDGKAGAPDGVNAQPSGKDKSESQGGAYPNPHSGKAEPAAKPGHGGQTHMEYSGPDNPNATTK